MSREKLPIVFIGSSAEGLRAAETLHGLLWDHFNSRLWTHAIFEPGGSTLEDLEAQLDITPFAVIFGTPDDSLIKRGNETKVIRDNLTLELGLFMGRLGRRRTFLVIPKGNNLGLPSNLLGLSAIRYDFECMAGSPTDRQAALQTVASQIRDAIDRQLILERSKKEELSRRIQASARFKAIQRLYGAVVQLRDLFLELPMNMIASIRRQADFESAKQDGAIKVQRLYNSWEEDAKLIEVRPEFENLTDVTKQAVLEIPYPEEALYLTTISGLQERVLTIGSEVANTFKNKRSVKQALGTAKEKTVEDIEGRIYRLQRKYSDWWIKHSAEIRRSTDAIHGALMLSMIKLGQQSIEGGIDQH